MARAFLRVVSGTRQGLSVPLREDQPLLIGRTRGDVRLDDPLVSGAHCRVVHRSGHFVLQDLGSTNGTTVDGRRIQDVVLRPGSEIVVGNTKLMLFGGDEGSTDDAEAHDAVAWLLDDEPLADAPGGPDTLEGSDAPDAAGGGEEDVERLSDRLTVPPGVSARVRVLAGPDKGKEFTIDSGTAWIGRGQGEVALGDPEVSRRHACLEYFGASMVFIRDGGSTNGTYHNGRRVQLSRVRPGDTVGCGKTVMKVLA